MSPTDPGRCETGTSPRRSVSRRSVSRRSVLASGATALGGAAAVVGGSSALDGSSVVGRASGQITQTAVVEEPERWRDANLAGFMVHLGGDVSPMRPDEIPACDLANWPPDEAYRYDATLINRKDADTPQQPVNLFVDANVNVTRGALFLVNTFTRCEGANVGVDLLQIGRRFRGTATGPHVDVEGDERPDEDTEPGGDGGGGAMGPGYGAVGALVAVAGLGGWLARRRGE